MMGTKQKVIGGFLGGLLFIAFAVVFFLLWQTQRSLNASQEAIVAVQTELQELTFVVDKLAGATSTPVPSLSPQPSPLLKNHYTDDLYHFELTFPEIWPKFQVSRQDNPPSPGIKAAYGFTFEGPFPAIDLYLTDKPFEEHLLQDYPLKWRDCFAVANSFDGLTFYYQKDDSYFECAQLSQNDCTYRKQIGEVMKTLKKFIR
jgi:hypothetical protein